MCEIKAGFQWSRTHIKIHWFHLHLHVIACWGFKMAAGSYRKWREMTGSGVNDRKWHFDREKYWLNSHMDVFKMADMTSKWPYWITTLTKHNGGYAWWLYTVTVKDTVIEGYFQIQNGGYDLSRSRWLICLYKNTYSEILIQVVFSTAKPIGQSNRAPFHHT